MAVGTSGATRPLMADDATQLVDAVRFQFLSYLRTYRFLAMLILTLLVTGLLTVIVIYVGNASGGQVFSGDVNGFFAITFSFVSLLIVLTASFFGGDAVAVDFGSSAGYFTLVLPIRRPVLLLGRYLAAFAAGLSLLVLQYGVFSALALHYYGHLSWELGASFGFSVLYLLAILSLAFALGSLFRRPVVALVATILLVLFGFSIAQEAVVALGYEPWMFASYAGQSITEIFSAPPHQNGVGVFAAWSPYPWEAAVIMIAYALVALGLAILLHARKEVTG
jgi:ABC-type transport system involved in multi-copper enzyme maturation permease subunit